VKKYGLLLLVVTSSLVGSSTGQAGKASTDPPLLIGDWRGDSICVVRPSACHDEKALYHVKTVAGSPHRYTLDADKVVDGKPVFMGSMECSYAPEKHELTCSTPRLVVHLALDGNSLNGTMNLPDGTVWRNITLRHD
jgi:hypothetical protein